MASFSNLKRTASNCRGRGTTTKHCPAVLQLPDDALQFHAFNTAQPSTLLPVAKKSSASGLWLIDFVALQLTAEGGWDAAQEAPFLYAAMDALASRAGSWAERQQRIRIEGATPQAAADMAEPVVVARQAVDFVKQAS